MRFAAMNQDIADKRPSNWLARRIWIMLSSRVGRKLMGKFLQFIRNGEGVPPESEAYVLRHQKVLEDIHLKLQEVIGSPPDSGFGTSVLERERGACRQSTPPPADV
jgi:hypothetical protein